MTPTQLGRVLTLAAFVAVAGHAQPVNIVPNGDFQTPTPDGKWPSAWKVLPNGKTQYTRDGDARWMRFEDGGRLKLLTPLKPEWRYVEISARMRAENLKIGTASWHNARIIVRLRTSVDAEECIYKPSPALKEDSEWRTVSVLVDIPEGMRVLDLEPGMYESTGVFELDDITVIPLTPEIAAARGAKDAALPPERKLYWGQEPVVDLNPDRSEVVLNGIWRFCPALTGAAESVRKGWGYIQVPGTWDSSWNWPPIVARGDGVMWMEFGNGRGCAKAWYHREVTVPDAWQGRAVLLDFQRVSTDAKVIVNGTVCGAVRWPYGQVDITNAVRFGEPNDVRVLVVAVQDAKEVMVIMGPNQISSRKAKLRTRGITGDVVLTSRPTGAHIRGLFVQTSVRRETFALDVELDGVDAGTDVALTAKIRDPDGQIVTELQAKARVEATGDGPVAKTSWDWMAPKLWDFRQPNLYTLHLHATAPGLRDTFTQVFGFREFRIKGKRFYLNGTELRLRPIQGEGYYNGNQVAIDGIIDGFMGMGFNIQELWPKNHDERGSELAGRELWATTADRKGWPLIGTAMSMSQLVGTAWSRKDTRERWHQRMREDLRRFRNHPSILMWAHSANRFGHRDDQNPLRIGDSSWDGLPESWKENARQGREATEMIRAFDPTRPVMSHQCGPVGDVYSLNNYLCMTPLQEREEWLSHWAEHGDMPYMAVEFGTPLHSTYSRGRNGGANAGVTELLPTEFTAVYLGEEAYRLESAQLRANILTMQQEAVRREQAGNPLPPSWHWNWHGATADGEVCEANDKLQELFVTETWRSWREAGITGGLIPWGFAGLGFQQPGSAWRTTGAIEELPPFRTGQRGTYFARLPRQFTKHMTAQGCLRVLRCGTAMKRVNDDTLAWIAGPTGATAAKNHHVYAGSALAKQVIVINDSRIPQSFDLTVTASLDGAKQQTWHFQGDLQVAENRRIPFVSQTPEVSKRLDGQLRLVGRVGALEHEHTFPFRVYPRGVSTAKPDLPVWDPEGDTSSLLARAGLAPQTVNGFPRGNVLVVGRNAMSAGRFPNTLETFVRDGGRLIIHAQDPEWLEKHWGLRVNGHVARRCWPVATQRDHPVVAGLDGEDFRDWAGSGTLVPERPTGLKDPMAPTAESYGDGWRWGNRGSVSSAMVEKPHLSGWTPILEGEFDLAYSPLLELRLGKGLVILNLLDVEDRPDEPMAQAITRRMVTYARTAPTGESTRGKAVSVRLGGGNPWQGLANVPEGDITKHTDVLLTDGVETDANTLERFAEHHPNGTAVVIPPWPEQLPFGLTTGGCQGRYAALPAAEEARGLGASDVHLRYDVELPRPEGKGVVHVGDGLYSLFRAPGGCRVWFVAARPDALETTETPYLHFSRWRVTRAVSQILANAGVEFLADGKIFRGADSQRNAIPLTGEWQMALGDHPADGGWRPVAVPGPVEDSLREAFDGAFWFRGDIDLPAELRGRRLMLHLGPIDDFDVTWVNGIQVGATGAETPRFYAHPRVYTVPAELTTSGRLTMTVRVWDHFGSGGFGADSAEAMKLVAADGTAKPFPIAGTWLCRKELRLPPAKTIGSPLKDPGVAESARSWHTTAPWPADVRRVVLPAFIEDALAEVTGTFQLRRGIAIPDAYAGHNVTMELGPVGNSASVSVNGHSVPTSETDGRWQARIPADVLTTKRPNEIVIKVINGAGPGGLLGTETDVRLMIPNIPESALWYVPGYRTDHAMGDSPTRYYRW